jgi:hypothetical protein
MNKYDHVRQAAKTQDAGDHHCHWPGCTAVVAPAMWGCKPHWFKLPIEIRTAIWTAYRPGQEISKTPSRDYLEAADRAQEWIKNSGFPAGDIAPSQASRVIDDRTRDLFS